MTDPKTSQSNIIPIRPIKATRSSEEKWGKDVMALGFSIIPSLIFKAQKRLKLSPTKLAILMQLADFWWDSSSKPWPSKETLSDRLSLSPRQVQRHIAELEEEGLVKRIERYAKHKGKLSNFYDLSGLVKRLKELEPEFREVKENSKAKNKALEKSGFRLKRKTTPN